MTEHPNDDAYELTEFNNWVERWRKKGYHRDTLKKAIAQLEEAGIIKVVRKFAWNILRLAVRNARQMLDLITRENSPRKKSRPHAENRNSDPSNPMGVKKDGTQQQQSLNDDLAEHLEVCEVAGLHYPVGQRAWMLLFSAKDFLRAVCYMVAYGERNAIDNPEGFVRTALEQGWDFDTYYQSGDVNYSALLQKLTEHGVKVSRFSVESEHESLQP